MSNRADAAVSPGRHMLRGSMWMIALRWALRLTGVVSTVILARLLTPSDFGIVATAMIFVGLMEMLTYAGQRLAIIRHAEPTREHYDTAWTLSVLLGIAIGAAIAALAPLTRYYFSDPRVVPVMQCLALRAVMSGFENIGTIDFRRDLHFDRYFLYGVIPKGISFVVTIGLAFLLRNYWALVAGTLTFELVLILLSYALHSYRPRFSLARVDELWSFSIWMLLRFIGNYLNTQVDRIAIGRVAGAAAMGRYAVASDLGASPSIEINEPMVAVLYSVMSAVSSDRAELRKLYLRTLSWSAVICASASVGVTCVAHDLVHVLLGPKWTDVEPLMGWLALAAGMLGLSSNAYTTFDAIGSPHVGARMQWVRLSFLAIAIVPVAWLTHNLELIAAARCAMTLIFLPNLFLVVGRAIDVSLRDYLEALWRPFFAAAAMTGVILLLNAVLPFEGVLRLLLDVISGVLSFALFALGAWRVSGMPESPEKDFWDFFRVVWLRYGVRFTTPPYFSAAPNARDKDFHSIDESRRESSNAVTDLRD